MTDVTVVRFSYEGDKFEILVKPDPALDYKLGRTSNISSVLISDEIYADSGKGTKPSTEKLLKAFGTEDRLAAAEIIMKKGDLNMTTDQRRRMIEETRKRIVQHIAKSFVDPRSHLPHPPIRIEQAMKDARVSIDPQKGAEAQIKDVVDKLRKIIALKSENMILEIAVPAQYASHSYSVLRSLGSMKQEEWLSNGSFKAILEISAASRPSVIERLGSITRGTATVEVAR